MIREYRRKFQRDPLSAGLWPVVGFLNALVVGIDGQMKVAFIELRKPSGPALPSFTLMLGALAVLVLLVFGLAQLVHGFRSRSTGVWVGPVTAISTVGFAAFFVGTPLLQPIGSALHGVTGYGSLDFYDSYLFYVCLIPLAWFAGVDCGLQSRKPSVQE